MNKNYIYYFPYILFLIFIIILLRWQGRRDKAQAVERNKIDEYEKVKAYSGAIAYIVCGLIFQLSIVIYRSDIPPGNEPVMVSMMIIGLIIIAFGLYKFYRYYSKQ